MANGPALQLRLVFKRELQQGVRAFEVEFVGDVGAVAIHGANADEEFVGDFLAGFVFSHQLEHAAFGFGQGRKPCRLLRLLAGAAAIEQKIGQQRRDVSLPGGDRANGVDDFAGGAVLEHVTLHAQIERRVEEAFLAVLKVAGESDE